jgi:hypothetical protein
MNLIATAVLLAFIVAVSAQCSLPTSYAWTDSGILAEPKTDGTSLQDFTHVTYDGKHLVYASYLLNNGISGSIAFGTFVEWHNMASVDQNPMATGAVASTLFFFRPTSLWILAYQGGPSALSYMVSLNPTNTSGWFNPQALFRGGPPLQLLTNPSLIGDDTTMYLFWTDYQFNKIFRAHMPIDRFPSTFTTHAEIDMEGFQQNTRLGGVQVYTVKGQTLRYLMIVEVEGSYGHYYQSFTSSRLGGSWTPQAVSESRPFAGKANSGASWTDDISRGDIIRSDPDQTFTIDVCNLQLLYQGHDPKSTAGYGNLPYRPGLLILNATFSSTPLRTTTPAATASVVPLTSTRTRTKTITRTATKVNEKTIMKTTTRTKIQTAISTKTATKVTTKQATKIETKTRTRTITKMATKDNIRTTTKFIPATVTIRTTLILTA